MGVAISPVGIDPRVSDFLEKPHQILIDGKWMNAASGKTFPTYNPATVKCSLTSPRAIVKMSSAL